MPRVRWVGIRLRLIAVALAAGALFSSSAASCTEPEPRRRTFERAADEAREAILPLPERFVILDEWDECGNGRDAECDGVVLLIDDRRSPDPPVVRLGGVLEKKGWRVVLTEGRVLGTLADARLSILSLSSHLSATMDPVLQLEAFLQEHEPDGIAYMVIRP